MEIKAHFSRIGYILLGVWVLLFFVMIFLEYSPAVMFIYVALSVFITGVKPFTYSILLEKDRVTIVWYKYFIKRRIVRDIQSVTMDVVYIRSSGEPDDAVLKIFAGPNCIHRAFANQGFEEADFRKLIVKLEKFKISRQVV
ncbi:hypothetical protein [Chitinophaga agri]|uniref:PH domain-containing protein n=1 Tax=Chitinophaga agri TaxID=2703787 RepID=A0A6B9Z743_9BACT|nr:hypothetical protein [Chitinophaga agri]QHS58068.1 hypothetical protein GWR21_00215 [Chitinophaga agri]